MCEISHSRHLKCAKEIVDKEGEGGIIKKLNNKTEFITKLQVPTMIPILEVFVQWKG